MRRVEQRWTRDEFTSNRTKTRMEEEAFAPPSGEHSYQGQSQFRGHITRAIPNHGVRCIWMYPRLSEWSSMWSPNCLSARLPYISIEGTSSIPHVDQIGSFFFFFFISFLSFFLVSACLLTSFGSWGTYTPIPWCVLNVNRKAGRYLTQAIMYHFYVMSLSSLTHGPN